MNNADSNKKILVGGVFELAGEEFSGQFFQDSEGNTVLAGKWHNGKKTLNIFEFLRKAVKSELSLPIQDDFKISEIGAARDNSGRLSIYAVSTDYGTFIFQKDQESYFFKVKKIPQRISFNKLPLIGKYFDEDDGLELSDFGFFYTNEAVQDQYSVFFELIGNGIDVKYNVPDNWLSRNNNSISEEEIKSGSYRKDNAYIVRNDSDNNSLLHWMDIHKTFGPVSIVRLGIGYDKGKIVLAGDIDVKITCLTFNLIGLNIRFPFGKLDEIDFGIEGLGIDMSIGATYIAGALMKDEYTDPNDESYTGMLTVNVDKFGLTILGNYEKKDGTESLFAFGALHMVLGGPPCFVVTGLSMGFGMNKGMVFPDVYEIEKFPLIEAARGDKSCEDCSPSEMLGKLNTCITSQDGETIIAMGITFTSFQIIKTCILGLINFGVANQVAILGSSTMDMPSEKGKTAYVHLGICIRAIYNIDLGILTIDGAVSNGSYVFAEPCKLTGEFAWYMWFKNEHKGDFVLSIGGYHKDYEVPSHYPIPKRVGVNWKISDQLSLSGEAYFALTPSCVMAGGALSLVYTWKKLSAWVKFKADMMISWLPFHYDVTMHASIGVSYTFKFLGLKKTATLETTVDIHMWGPDFAIEIYVKWFIISFTISYGKKAEEPKAIDWDTFANTMLVNNQVSSALDEMQVSNASRIYVDIRIANGIEEQGDNNDEKHFVIKNGTPVIELSSIIPITELIINGTRVGEIETRLGVLPMGENKCLKHEVDISITGENEKTTYDLCIELDHTGVPNSLWGRFKLDVENASENGIIQDVLNAAYLSFKEQVIDYKLKYNSKEPAIIHKDIDKDKEGITNEGYKYIYEELNEKDQIVIPSFPTEKMNLYTEDDWSDFKTNVEMSNKNLLDYFRGEETIIKKVG